jgi:uncharacterized protein (TIGR02996 family)
MTAQVGDLLRYRNEECELFANPPLHDGEPPPGANLTFHSHSTANWRGYVATWEFRQNLLYLAAIRGWRDRREVGMDEVFPGLESGIHAYWVSGRLRVPRGECIAYVHMGYGSTYERDLWLGIRLGRLVFTEEIDNRTLDQVSAEVTDQLETVYGNEEAAFIRAILACPGDRTPRLVYADWLDEHDDPRGALIRNEGKILEAAAAWKAERLRRLAELDIRYGFPDEEPEGSRELAIDLAAASDWLWLRLMDYPLPPTRLVQ